MNEIKQSDKEVYSTGFAAGWRQGREAQREDIVSAIKPCLERDNSLIKIIELIQDFK